MNCGKNIVSKTNNCCTKYSSEYHVWTSGDMEVPKLWKASGMESEKFLDDQTR